MKKLYQPTMGCFQTKCASEGSLEKINIAGKCLQSERRAFEQEKLQFKVKVKMEREQLEKFDAEFEQKILESEKSDTRKVKEKGEFLNQQEELEKGKKSAFKAEEKMQKEKNKALSERERSLHRNEDKLVKSMDKCDKEEERIKRATLKQQESEASFASFAILAFSKELEGEAKRCQKVRELDQKEEKLKRDNRISSKDKEFIRERKLSLLKKEAYVSSIEVTIKADVKAIFKRENAVERREREVEKTVAKQKKRGERLTMHYGLSNGNRHF